MPVEEWSKKILLAKLENEPAFSEDLHVVTDRLDRSAIGVVLDFKAVSYLNSSNLASLLRLRQQLVAADRRLILCAVPDSVWAVMLTTGLDKVFEFSPDVPAAIASLQLGLRSDGGIQ